MNAYKAAVRAPTPSAHARRRDARRRRVRRPARRRASSRRRWSSRWRRGPIVFALANPDPEIGYDEARAARARRRSWPPGRSRLSRTRSTTCSASRSSSAARSTCAPREINEDMKIAAAQRARRAGQAKTCPTRSRRPTAAALPLRPRLHHPQAVRPARAALGRAGRGAGRHGERAWRASSSTSTSTASRCRRGLGSSREMMRIVLTRPSRVAAPHRVPRGRARQDDPRGAARSGRRRHRAARSCSAPAQRDRRAKIAELELGDLARRARSIRPAHVRAAPALRDAYCRAAPAQGRDPRVRRTSWCRAATTSR